MTARSDDDALSWDGDDDPTLDVSTRDHEREPLEAKTDVEGGDRAPAPAEPAPLPDGFTAVGKGSEAVAAERRTDLDASTPAMGNAALIGVGIFAGVYLLLALGWLLGAGRLQLVAQLFLDPVSFQVTLWLAVLALPLWFATVFWLTRGARTWVRFVLLAAGAVLLIPWPFVLAGAFA